MVLAIMLVGCDKEDNDPNIDDCLITDTMLVLEPVCSFDPRQATTVQFPVIAKLDGLVPGHDEFTFSWSKDPDFNGSAISISYEQLPLVLILTEISTGCEAEATLGSDYWE